MSLINTKPLQEILDKVIELKGHLEDIQSQIEDLQILLTTKNFSKDKSEMDNRFIHEGSFAMSTTMSTGNGEAYSKQWKWPTKTLFVLKVINRPISANEIIRVLEWYERSNIPEEKRTVVFAALTNLAKESKIERSKPGTEYLYYLKESNTVSTEFVEFNG